MKKILSLTLMMLAFVAGAWAQDSHFQLSYQQGEDGNAGSTTVYAELDLNPAPSSFANYEVAAFIGDECRAVRNFRGTQVLVTNYWVLDVKGNFDKGESDTNQPITFKVYNSGTDTEFDLTPSETIIFTNDGKYGEPSNLIKLSGVEWSLAYAKQIELVCNVGDDISNYIREWFEIQPTDTELDPPALVYTLSEDGDDGVLSLNGTTITALKSGVAFVEVRLEGINGAPVLVEVNVNSWATDGKTNVPNDELTVTIYNEDINIFEEVRDAVTFLPEDYDFFYELTVESDDNEIVEPQIEPSDGEITGNVYAKKAGVATLTFTVRYPDYLNRDENGEETMKENSFKLKVKVNQGLTSLDLTSESIIVNKGATYNLTDLIKPYPENAVIDYSKLTYDYNTDVLKIENNILTALQVTEGEDVLVNYPDPDMETSFKVVVVNPATDLQVNKAEITVNKDDWQKLTSELAAAVTTVPADATDQIVWVSEDETIVALYGQTVTPAWNPIKGGTVTMRAEIRDYDLNSYTVRLQKTVTVTVVPAPESIEVSPDFIYVNIGDDFSGVLQSIVKVLPENAYSHDWHIDWTKSIQPTTGSGFAYDEETGAMYSNAMRRTPYFLYFEADANSNATGNVGVFTVNQMKNLEVDEDDILVNYQGESVDISSQVEAKITMTPDEFIDVVTGVNAIANRVNATVTSSDPNVVDVSGTSFTTNSTQGVTQTYSAIVKSKGTATITVSLTYTDLLLDITEPDVDHSTTVSYSFDVVVSTQPGSFSADYPTEMAIGQTYQIVLTPQPADADIDLDKFSMSSEANNLPETWPYVTFGQPAKQDGTIVINVYPQEPDEGTLTVSYPNADGKFVTAVNDEISVGVPVTLDEGWQWRTLWSSIPNGDFESFFGDDGVLEVRSQDALMARDSQIGYFGDLYDNGLEGNVAYKIKATSAIDIDKARVQYDGTFMQRARTQSLLRGWTWIPYPYYHAMTFSQLNIAGSEGDKIVGKNGFAEFDGTSWTGSIDGLSPWQSYLYYSDEANSFTWSPEASIYTVEDNNVVPGGNSRRKVNTQSTWQYNPRPYRDNMSIVAEINGQSSMVNDQWTVGAFVGDECRGEGVCVNGRMFITVHAEAGEQVSFRLCNELTGELYDIDQTVRFGAMLGSMKAPFRMSSQAVVTGVKNIENGKLNIESYDLGGRRVNNSQSSILNSQLKKGLTIQRRSDGSVRKVVK